MLYSPSMPLTISSTIKHYPKLPYDAMAREVLGTKHEVSLTFVGADRARSLNRSYRGKDYIPNVLSFPLTDKVGEVYIAPVVAVREASAFGMTAKGYIGYLFIHGLLHLKGLDHGPEMDKLEKKFRAHFKLS